jgi:hypothetical protein
MALTGVKPVARKARPWQLGELRLGAGPIDTVSFISVVAQSSADVSVQVNASISRCRAVVVVECTIDCLCLANSSTTWLHLYADFVCL